MPLNMFLYFIFNFYVCDVVNNVIFAKKFGGATCLLRMRHFLWVQNEISNKWSDFFKFDFFGGEFFYSHRK
jgi:hypothetical protein